MTSRRPARSASTRAQRASARNMTAAAPAPVAASDPSAPLEPVASTSNMRTDLESLNAHPDSDDAMLSRSNSVHLIDEVENISSTRSSLRREKGKGKERGAAVRVKEEPAAFSLSTHEPTLANPSVCLSPVSQRALLNVFAVQRRPLFGVSLPWVASIL